MVMEETMDSEMSLSNMVLGFFEDFERERWPENDDDEEDGDTAESKAFWRTQHSQLHVSPPLHLIWQSAVSHADQDRSSKCSSLRFSGQ
jgi:hypothetical protein